MARSSRIGKRQTPNNRPLQIVEILETRRMLSALTPTQVRHAYGFDQITFTNTSGQVVSGDGSGQTIAIVDAYDAPNIASDLKTFDAAYGISDYDSSGNFALTKVTPQSSTTQADAGWALEISLDVQWAHAIAPKAHILLVEAKSSSLTDLIGAVNYARNQSGVVAVSMSWGSNEFSTETNYDSYFTTPSGHIGGSGLAGGVTFVAASGDSSSVTWPAISSKVLAVGGTSLTLNTTDNSWSSETAWSSSGGGTSRYVSIPSYQKSVLTGKKRGNPDVAYDADPNTGFSVYDSYAYNGSSGWMQVGGTSAGAPQWAALVAIVDQGRSYQGKGSLDGATQVLPAIYSLSSSDFHDITSGANGLYSAKTGYDLVTGRGSPIANNLVADLITNTASAATTTTKTNSANNTTTTSTTTTVDNPVFPPVNYPGSSWHRHPPFSQLPIHTPPSGTPPLTTWTLNTHKTDNRFNTLLA